MKTVFMYSGQGSQYYQMGADLFERNRIFSASLESMDRTVRRSTGWSVLERVYDPARRKIDPMTDIELSSAAIYMYEIALTRVLQDNGIEPDCLLGASLGTFAAASVAGCYDAGDHVLQILEAARITRRTSPDGAMLAILSDSAPLIRDGMIPTWCELAAVNFATHFTVSTLRENLPWIAAYLAEREITSFELPTTRPYHSRWIDDTRAEMERFVERQSSGPPRLPLVCCATVGKIDRFGPREVWRVMREPIWFQKTALALESQGPFRYIDLGPSGTLANFLKYLLPCDSRSEIVTLMGPMQNSLANLARLLSQQASA